MIFRLVREIVRTLPKNICYKGPDLQSSSWRCFMIVGCVLALCGNIGPALQAQPHSVCDTITEIPTTECAALITFYTQLQGQHWQNKCGWLITDHPCEWYGVECRDGHVVELSLRDNSLSGTLPPEIGDLRHLQYLDLGDNQLTGPLPTELGQLESLQGLNVRNNRLNGPIPDEIGRLSKLEWLYLSQNEFEGPLPTSFEALTRLHTLYFRDTNLCESLHPDFQAWLKQIVSVGRSGIACDCSVISEIPALECRALFALFRSTHGEHWWRSEGWLRTLSPCTWEHVQCQDNHVTGLLLPNNNLQGILPPELGHLTALKVFDIHENAVEGPLPMEIGNMTALTHFDARDNSIEGQLPWEIGQLDHLVSLDVSHNRLEGSLPLSFANLSTLRALLVNHNRFSGSLPVALGQLRALSRLDVSHNGFYGSPPETLANLTSLRDLDLHQTHLRGALPRTLSALASLQAFRFGQTNICIPNNEAFRVWMYSRPILEATSAICPSSYTSIVPSILLLLAGSIIVLPGFYLACVAVFGETFVPPERLAGYYRKHGAPREGLPIQMLVTGLFALSVELLWGLGTLFEKETSGYGFGIGLILYLGYTIISRRIRRRTRIIWVGRLLGLLICLFLACFLLVSMDFPYTSMQVLSLVLYILVIVGPVWLMTSGVSTGGYWELMAEGLFLGMLWGMLTGGILGETFCTHSALLYGGMSDLLTYRVSSQTLPEVTRRFLANELTGIFLFSLLGTVAGAVARSVQNLIVSLKSPVHLWIRDRLTPVLTYLKKIA